MSFITLADFRSVTGLSPATVLGLLEGGQLSCRLDPERGLLVDTDAVSTRQAIAAILAQGNNAPDIELVEEVARVIRDNLDAIVEQALNR